jgi:hypothetical protein
MKKPDNEIKLKSLKISEPVHTKLKIHVAKTKGNMTEFADAAIAAALKTPERK